jgi:glycosyltransferase involved in cell wall biosynthesis
MSHVLFISHARGIHGAEAVMVQAVKACAAKGARITVAVPSIVPDAGLEETLKEISNVRVWALPYRAAGVHACRTNLVRVYNTYALGRLKSYVLQEKVDVIYSNTSITILGAALAKATGVRHVWHWHEPVDKRFGWHPSLKNLYVRLAQSADTIVCISHQQQQEWQRNLGITLPHAQIIYNPIKHIAVSQPVAHEGIRFGFIGHFEERKNLPLLVHAFEKLHAQYPNTKLSLCGALGDEDCRYIETMTALRSPFVEILPQTSDVASFYAQIDVLVLPSWRETMPLVVFEAMQAGVCVLQTNRSGMSELIEDGKESLFFSPDDKEGLLTLLTRCMDTDYRQQIAKTGQQKALQLVNNQHFDQQIQSLLCE